MWDGTKQLAHALANQIRSISPETVVKVFNISQTDKNDIMTQVFKSKAIAVGSPTVGKSILSSVGGWLHFLSELHFKEKKAAVFGCYGWSGEGNKVLREELTKSGFSVVESESKVNWNPTDKDFTAMDEVAKALCAK
jgi:flavorubredoxin